MIIDQLPAISSPQTGDELPIERGTNTYKIDYDALASAIINKLGGDPVTLAHGGTGAASAPAARANLSVYSKAETDAAIAQSTATRFGPNSATSFDDLTTPGMFSVSISTTGKRPVANIGSYAVIVISNKLTSTTNASITQIAIPTGSNTPNGVYIRNRSSAGVWSGWYTISATAVA